MSDQKYTFPGAPDWTFSAPKLQHRGGASFIVTTSTTAQEIAEAVKRILRGTTLTPDEAEFEAVAQAAMQFDWQAMLGPFPDMPAPLLNARSPAQKPDNAAQIEQICALVRKLAT